MFEVKRKMGQFSASWNDGTEFIDPDPLRAMELAAHDAIDRMTRTLELAKAEVRRRRHRESIGGYAIDAVHLPAQGVCA